MPAVVNYAAIQGLKRVLSTMLAQTIKASEPFLWYKKITDEPPAKLGASVDSPYGGDVPMMEKLTGNGGQMRIYPLSVGTFNVANEEFGVGVAIPTIAYERDEIGAFASDLKTFMSQQVYKPLDLIRDLLNAAHSTLCFDGQYLADTDHVVAGASVANMVDSADNGEVWGLLDLQNGARLCTFQVEKPLEIIIQNEPKDYEVFYKKQIMITAEMRGHVRFNAWDRAFFTDYNLTAANFGTIKKAFESFKDSYGKLKNRRATDIIVGAANSQTAHDLFDKDGMLVVGGTTNTLRGKVNVIDTDAGLAISLT